MVTIYDLAKACGCSSATVSKALNNYPDVNVKTKERILKMAKEMGFTPSSQARALSTKKTWNIGVLFEDENNSGLTHYYFSRVLQAVKDQVEEKGYDLTFISKNLGSDNMTYLEHCRWRNTEGVIIACIDFKDPQVVELMQSEIPVVTIDFVAENRNAIMSDNFAGLYELTSHLIELGHKDISYIYGHPSYVTSERINGFKRAMEDSGIALNEGSLVESRYDDKKRNIQVIEKFAELDQWPTAIIFPDDYSAVWGIKTLREMGIRVPEDISVAGFDGLELGEMIQPRLTTMMQNTRRIGSEAALKCIQMLESKDSDTTKVICGIQLIEGGTCAAPRQTPIK